jgi:hypothetical protein
MLAKTELSVALPFSLADARLSELISGEGLRQASNNAYEAGLREFHLQVGPVRAISALSKRVHVCVLPPRSTPAGTIVPFRWLATGITGQLFPALDADLDLSPDGEDATHLVVNARYEPPLGSVGAKIDRMLLKRLAAMLVQRDGAEPDGRGPGRPAPLGDGTEGHSNGKQAA